MSDNANKEGEAVVRSRKAILEDLRTARLDLDCSIDEARAVIAIEAVEQIREQVRELAETMGRRWNLAEVFILSQYGAQKQANKDLENKLEDLGYLKKK